MPAGRSPGDKQDIAKDNPSAAINLADRVFALVISLTGSLTLVRFC